MRGVERVTVTEHLELLLYVEKISEDEKEGICDKVKTLKYSGPNKAYCHSFE